MNNRPIKDIVIVGGGTAGWLTAGLLAAEHGRALNVTLIESPDVNTIGVGEGTWPSMRRTIDRIGISELTFLKTCGASFKQGSKFVGWKTGAVEEFYYHPFTEPKGYGTTNHHRAWQKDWSNLSFAEAVTVQAGLCEANRAPKHLHAPDYVGATNYGYHLDAGKFAVLLKDHCTQHLGVRHVLDHVERIPLNGSGYIASVCTRLNGEITGDLFVDCTGVACLLLGQTLNVPFLNKGKFSINDSALALQIPYSSPDEELASATVSTAQEAGWTWDIGLSHRRGVGYVYSSAHTTEDAAEKCVRDYISRSVGRETAESLSSKKLSITAGYREQMWCKNCVAVGMSAGFIEPLEASALALVEMSVNMISDELPFTFDALDVVAKRFSRRFTYRWERVIDFLKLHYVLSQRRDTEYWRDVVTDETTPDHLKELLSLWRHRPPYYQDFIHNEEAFPSASYQFVLYGMGFETLYLAAEKGSDNAALAQKLIKENLAALGKFRSTLPTNRQLLNRVAGKPLTHTRA